LRCAVLAAALAFVVAMPLFAAEARVRAYLYSGTMGGRFVHLYIVDNGQQLLGATFYPGGPVSFFGPPVADVHLLTGDRRGGRVTLHEWKNRNEQMATLKAEISYATLTGRLLRGTSRSEAFELSVLTEASPLIRYGETVWPVFDRMHDAIRGGRWEDAQFDAKLACFLTTFDCGWFDALPFLAVNQVPPERERASWAGLLLERERRPREAFKVNMDLCKERSRIACGFMLDLIGEADPSERDAALRLACTGAHMACEQYWGKNEVDLIDAAFAGDLETVDRLLGSSINVNTGGGVVFTPLEAAVLANSPPIVRALLDHGADPNRPGRLGVPLVFAVDNHRSDIVLLLLQHGAKLGPAKGALWQSAYDRRADVVKAILDAGEHPDDFTYPAGSALTAAVDKGDEEIVKMLLDRGADPDLTTKFSLGSPIDHARRLGRRRILKLLVAARDAVH
jgi:hypothetical protein